MCGIFIPQPRIESVPPAVEVLATGLPEKSQHCAFLNRKNLFREMVGCVMEETETPTGVGERATERL